MAVHFPIALLVVGFAFELASLFSKNAIFARVSMLLLVIGALGAAVSFFSGRSAGAGMEEGDFAAAMQLHENAATWAFALAAVTSVFAVHRFLKNEASAWAKWLGAALFALTVAAVARTGYLGGQLVFKHGAGVELALPDFSR